MWQCFGRYLKLFGDMSAVEVTTVDDLNSSFFPDGFETEDANFTVSMVLLLYVSTAQYNSLLCTCIIRFDVLGESALLRKCCKLFSLQFRALIGQCVSLYQVTRQEDPKLHKRCSVDKCVSILCFLRLLTQCILPKENLCWLVYNGQCIISQ